MEERKTQSKEGDGAKICAPVSISEIVKLLTPEVKTKLLARYDMKNFARVFEDKDICETCLAFFRCGLNVSRTARESYMHRNTLMYRLDKVRVLTGLDIRELDSAVTFELLYRIYSEKRSNLR